MLDLFNFPGAGGSGACDVQVFQGPAGAQTTSLYWRQWQKPRNATNVFMLAIGGGGGGGGGRGAGSGTARGGGGGGGGGGIVSWLGSAYILPDSLYVCVGLGGAGGAGGTNLNGSNGTNATRTLIGMIPATTVGGLFLASANTPGFAGSGGTTTTGGGGSNGLIATVADSIYAQLGVWIAQLGQSGSAGGTGATTGADGTALGIMGSNLCGGGTGGGGIGTSDASVRSGGAVTGFTNLISTLPGGVGNGTLTGQDGWTLVNPTIWSGGTGGGASGTTTGGKGGNGGGYGCGGGGGGGGTPTGGRGGDGSNGMALIISW